MNPFIIHRAEADHWDAALGAIVLAFSSDPAARWLYRDTNQYWRHFPSFVNAFAGSALEHGSAYLVENFSGVALWLPPGVHPDEESVLTLLKRTVARELQAEVFAVFEQMNRHHPTEPHWYLPMIGVDPIHQGCGAGSALLKHALRRCDQERKLAYLESSNAKNISLYERHGFELLTKIQRGNSAPIFPMLREPH